MKLRTILSAVLMTGLPLCAIAEESSPASVTLQVDSSKNTRSILVEHEEGGTICLPFATPSGKLLLKTEGALMVADLNNDGKIDQTDGPGVGSNKDLEIPVKTHGMELKYILRLRSGQKTRSVVGSPCLLKGQYNGGDVILLDTDLNGRFNDACIDKISIGKFHKSHFTPRTVIDGITCNVTLPDDSNQLTIEPYVGETGKFTINCQPGYYVIAQITSRDASLNCTVTSGETVSLPLGKYIIHNVQYIRGSISEHQKNNRNVVISSEPGELNIKKGNNDLDIGKSFNLGFKLYKSDETKYRIDELEISDSSGFYFTYQSSPSVTINSFVKAGDKRAKISKLGFG